MQSEMSAIFSRRKPPALKQAVWQSETLPVATLEKPDFSSLSKISVSEPRTEHSSALQHLFSWLCSFNSLDNMARVQQLPSVNKPDPSPKEVYDVHQLRWELRTITSDQIFNTSRLDITSQILRLE